jgi:hypothetical protein
MSNQICLYLKVPRKPPTLLHRLENSFLETLIEYKPITATNPVDTQVILSVQSAYQLNGTVEVVDGELIVQFAARNTGIHTAKIFANTREICRPVVFLIKRNWEVESLDQTSARTTPADYTDSGLASGASTIKGVVDIPRSPSSQISSPGIMDSPNAFFPGDLHGHVSGATFNQLLMAKLTNQIIPGVTASTTEPVAMSPNTFRRMNKDVRKEMGITHGHRAKRRCDICSRKMKSSKCVTFWKMDFCDSCCKSNFMHQSAVEHFKRPSIKECNVKIPSKRRGTKMSRTKMMIPDVNLRGLGPNDIRNAMIEFRKFDLEGEGWMDKAILMPLLKACFTYTIPDSDIRILLTSKSFISMVESMGITSRDKIHHVEYLGLLAFIARERQRSTQGHRSQHDDSDQEMTYAFQKQLRYKSESVHTKLGSSQNTPINIQQSILSQDELPRSPTDINPLSRYRPLSFYPDVISKSPTKSIPHEAIPPIEINQPSQEVVDTLIDQDTEQNITSDQTPKKNPGDMMEQLKLTGDERADAWMLY